MTNNTDPAGLSSSPHLPTREQIARVMADIDARNFPLTAHYEYADAVLALLQNGADR